MLRQSRYGRLAGYADTNDAERLCVDPAMRHVAGGRAIEHTAASTSLMGRFETEILKQIILDMDSSVSPTHGNQEGSALICETTRCGSQKIAAISMRF